MSKYIFKLAIIFLLVSCQSIDTILEPILKEDIKQNKPDGLLPAYKGVHIHSIYGSNYAFIETKKLKLKQSKCSAIHVGRKSVNCPLSSEPENCSAEALNS